MPTEIVDGNDVLAVQRAVRTAVERARRGEGPSYVETLTYRIRGHLEAEDAFLGGGTYRTLEDIAAWQAIDKDPIHRFETFLKADGIASDEEIAEIHSSVTQQIEDAIAFAEAGEPADPMLPYSLMFADQEA